MFWFSRFKKMSEQKKWDDQIAMNRSATWREAHQIATKMQKCPNNPRNGGQGFVHGTDRRGEFWDYGVDDGLPEHRDLGPDPLIGSDATFGDQ